MEGKRPPNDGRFVIYWWQKPGRSGYAGVRQGLIQVIEKDSGHSGKGLQISSDGADRAMHASRDQGSKATAAKDVARFIESLGTDPGGDEGFKFGDPAAPLSGVLVCWMCTLAAIEQATAEGCNMIVCHEEMHYPYAFRDPGLEKYITWTVNRRRISALAAGEIVVYRAHGMLDHYCLLDDFAAQLGLSDAAVSEGFYRIYDVEPRTVAQLVEQVKAAVGMDCLRVTGDPQRVVSRVGLPWGGLGLSVNVAFIEGLLTYNPDVLIAGEADEYAMFYCRDADVVMIETSHAISENFGLAHFAQDLAAHFPDVRVVFHRCPVPWQRG